MSSKHQGQNGKGEADQLLLIPPVKQNEWPLSENPEKWWACGPSSIHAIINFLLDGDEFTKEEILKIILDRYSITRYFPAGLGVETICEICDVAGLTSKYFKNCFAWKDVKKMLINTLKKNYSVLAIIENHSIAILTYQKNKFLIMEPDNLKNEYEWYYFNDLYSYWKSSSGHIEGIIVKCGE